MIIEKSTWLVVFAVPRIEPLPKHELYLSKHPAFSRIYSISTSEVQWKMTQKIFWKAFMLQILINMLVIVITDSSQRESNLIWMRGEHIDINPYKSGLRDVSCL